MRSALEAIQDAIHAHRCDKDARFLIESLIRQYRGMRAESREELTVVYRSWLSSEDVAKAGLAPPSKIWGATGCLSKARRRAFDHGRIFQS
jgi:hypothetical protein